jgi:S1-C subfamily serine protease
MLGRTLGSGSHPWIVWVAAPLACLASCAWLAASPALAQEGQESPAAQAPAQAPAAAAEPPAGPEVHEFSDVEGARDVQSRIAAMLPLLLAASVGVEITASDGRHTGSGTVITPGGLVLTAGHVSTEADVRANIVLPGGRIVPARTLGLHWQGAQDCGLVQCELAEGETLDFVPLAPADSLSVGEWVVAVGYTYGSFQGRPSSPPAVRIGRIRRMREGSGSIEMDAPLASGDSGGGLFDLEGRLVGVNSSAGPEPQFNNATSVAFVYTKMDAMLNGEVSGRLAESSEQRAQRRRRRPPSRLGTELPPMQDDMPSRRSSAIHAALVPLVEPLLPSVAEVFVDSRSVGYALAVDGRGHYIAKDSDVGDVSADVALSMPDGVTVAVARVARDRNLDLVLLRSREESVPVDWASDGDVALGEIVVSVGRDIEPLSWGVRALDRRVAGRGDVTAAYLGVGVRELTDEEREARGVELGAMVASVLPGSAAARAKLVPGDIVMRIASTPVSNADDVGRSVRGHAAGDVIEVEAIDAEGTPRVLRARLGVRQLQSGPQASTPMFPASRRSSGFGEVLQHDGPVAANRIGGPVVDLDGRVVGMNIARVDRTKTYALPAQVVSAAAQRLLAEADAATGPLPLRDPMDSAIPVEASGGLLRLDAMSAALFGHGLHFDSGDGDGERIIGWSTDADAARWVAQIAERGTYEVTVIQSCPERFAGGDFTVDIEGVALAGKIRATSSWSDLQRVAVGRVTAEEPGSLDIVFRPVGVPAVPFVALQAIELKLVTDGEGASEPSAEAADAPEPAPPAGP